MRSVVQTALKPQRCGKAVVPGHDGVSDDRHCQNRHKHQHTLNKVGGANSLKAAEQGVNREEDGDDDSGYDLDDTLFIAVAVLEEAGDRQGVARYDGVLSQPGRYEVPVENGAEQQTDGDPDLAGTCQVNGAGETHQQPAAHVGSLRGERGSPSAEVSAAEEVVLIVLGFLGVDNADADHDQHIHRKGNQNNNVVCCHDIPPYSICIQTLHILSH